MKQFLIGSYAPEGEPSIFGVELDEEKQKLRLLWEDRQVQNPSFLYLHPNCHVLYAVEERVPNGGLAVMIKTEEGWLLKERLLAGSAPCHLEMTPTHDIFWSATTWMERLAYIGRMKAE